MVNCGHVYFLHLPIANKEKLLVPAYILADGRVRVFVINTERTAFQINRPEISKHVLPLEKNKNESFLTHNSWLTCHEVIGGLTVAEIERDAGRYRGSLDNGTLAAVRALISESRLHSEADKTAILAQWPNNAAPANP